jgi:hypothetical protein
MDSPLWSIGASELAMALTLWRWVALSAVLCGIVTIAILREPKASRRNKYDASPFEERENLTRSHVSTASERLRLLAILDSLRPVMRNGAPGQSRVFMSSNLRPNLRRVLELLIDRIAPARPSRPVTPVDVMFVLDTSREMRGVPSAGFGGIMRADYLLPRPNSSDRCVVLARLKAFEDPKAFRRLYAGLLGDATRARLLGPCGFYEWFGIPGPQIDSWLRVRGWNLGLASAWDSPYPRWNPRRWWSRYDRSGIFGTWPVREVMTHRGFACAAGSEVSCDMAVVEGPSPGADVIMSVKVWSTGIVSPRASVNPVDRLAGWWYQSSEELGPREWTILAEMARTLGPDRFAKMWRSDLPIREAFRAAAGMELGDWTQEWSQRLYGPQGRGPGIPTLSAIMGLAVAVVAFAFALVMVQRRQVA